MGLGETQLPRETRMGGRGQWRSARTAVVTADQHHIGMRLGDTRCNRTDTDLGYQLHADPSLAVGVLEIVDQLSQILDRVDVVMRRRRDQTHSRRGMTSLGDPGINLGARQLTALARLCTLRHLDLDFFGVDEILTGHTKTTRSHLLDGGILRIAIGHGPITLRVLATFTGVALATNTIHGDGKRFVSFLTDRAVAHGARLEATHDVFDGLNLFERDRLRFLEAEQPAQSREVARAIIDEARVRLEC